MASKKIVGCGILVVGITRLAFSLVVHSPHVIDVIEALFFISAGVVLYATNAHKIIVSISQTMYERVELKSLNAFNDSVANFFRRLSKITYENVELKRIDAFNYFIANLITSFSQRIRKAQSGMLAYNMLMVIIGVAMLIVLILFVDIILIL